MIPAEKRWEDKKVQEKADNNALANCMRHGGSMGINTWFNRQEQNGDQPQGLKRFDGLGDGGALSNSLAFTYDAKDVQRSHHINRLTTDSRNRWKDFDPKRMPSSPPPSSRKSARSIQSSQSNRSTNSSTIRVPNLPFPQEYLPEEMTSADSYNDDTYSLNSDVSNSHRQVVAGSYTKVASTPRGKKQFYTGNKKVSIKEGNRTKGRFGNSRNTPNSKHRKLKLSNNRMSFHTSKEDYNPMKTSVGGLLCSPQPKIERLRVNKNRSR